MAVELALAPVAAGTAVVAVAAPEFGTQIVVAAVMVAVVAVAVAAFHVGFELDLAAIGRQSFGSPDQPQHFEIGSAPVAVLVVGSLDLAAAPAVEIVHLAAKIHSFAWEAVVVAAAAAHLDRRTIVVGDAPYR